MSAIETVPLLLIWAVLLVWLVVSVLHDLRRDRAAHHAREQELRQVAARRTAERREDERAHQERLRRQRRQIEELDALYELPSASHRGGRTR